MQMKFYSPLTADFFPNEPDYEDEVLRLRMRVVPLDGHDLLQYADDVDEAVKSAIIADFNGDLMQYYHVEDDSVRSRWWCWPSVEI